MARKTGSWEWRAAGAGGVLCLGLAVWLICLFPGPRLLAVLGVGPVDGDMRITNCYEATDAQGYADGIACEGRYTPRSADEPRRRITLSGAAEKHRPGTLVEVRTSGGLAFELSGHALSTWVTVTGLILAPFLPLSLGLFASARHARWSVDGDYLLWLIFLVIGALLLGFVVGIPVEIALALFG
ncbi:hypothetical protein OG230_32385 [Streptomyces sp. NBC_00234]|uniref:hypothetical protein n=1 Tax=Streptomyces sp. NBC_00234 TaxID=2903638 RepID=UPI002E2DECAD|nr:hypothetical protein [Streptomyces sp. NBC_00234]